MERTKEIEEKLESFFQIHASNYPKDILDLIQNTIEDDTYLENIGDIVYQIYTNLELIPKENNRYFGFLRELNNHFDIHQNIIEVAGGLLPVFGKELGKMQTSGTVTVYDPLLVVESFGTLKLKKEKFSMDTNIDSSNLLVGISPCEATESIILKSNQEHKELFLALCGCDHTPHDYGYGYSYYRWESYVYHLVESTLDDNAYVDVTYLDNNNYYYPYPILMKKYNRK